MKRVSFLVLSILAWAGCTTDWLEVEPVLEVPMSDYYTTEERITQALIAAYAPLAWPDFINFGEPDFPQYNSLILISDCMSDDVKVGGSDAQDGGHFYLMSTFSATPENTAVNLWRILYTGIYRANLVIEKMNEVQNITGAKKDRILAEAHTLRAYYYSWLWKIWGNIPYYTTNPLPPYFVTQITADEVYPQIIADLDFALEANRLPAAVPVGQVGRFTRAAAQMLKANVVMYQCDAGRYGEVLADMRSIINSEQYSLYPDFADIWLTPQEWCCESIFEINYSDYPSNRNWENPMGSGGTVFPILIGINEFVGSEFESGWGFMPVEQALYDLYDLADLRRDGGILNFAAYAQANVGVSYTPRFQDTGYFNLKYIARKDGVSKYIGTADAQDLNYDKNYRVYRFSETLLIAAELIVRTSGGAVEADNYLNRVRARAFGTTVDDPIFTPKQKTATLENLLLENRFEFACEGHRFWDLVRFGKAQEVLGSRGYTANKKYQPIPQSEIDQAKGTLTQNPYNN